MSFLKKLKILFSPKEELISASGQDYIFLLYDFKTMNYTVKFEGVFEHIDVHEIADFITLKLRESNFIDQKHDSVH